MIIILSEDTFPIYKHDEFIENFEKIHNNKSIFNYKNKYKNYYKTSQWWILNRLDVITIIKNEIKYENKFKYKIEKGCIDEYYFLSILMWEDPKYIYTNSQIMYDKWLEYTIQKSPSYFNHLLQNDIVYIKQNNCLFLRKITQTFTPNIYTTKRKLYVVYIGTETNQDNIVINNEFDLILIISISINNVKKELVNKSIYIFNIIYKFLYETILNITIEQFIYNWELIIFTTEKFNMNNYNMINKTKEYLPYNKFKFKDKQLTNKKEFYYITDNLNELAFCIKTKK